MKISDSARKLVETARNKVSDFHTMHFSSINGEIREIPAEYKCENLFKLDLKATSISGEQNAFEGCSENQSEVFEKWLDENASEYLTEDEMKDLKEKINAMTADVDSLNAQEGYRGTSYESVFLLSASEAGLRKVNEMYVPEQFQAGFSDMIDEYVHFNDWHICGFGCFCYIFYIFCGKIGSSCCASATVTPDFQKILFRFSA